MDELRERLGLVERLEPPEMWHEAQRRAAIERPTVVASSGVATGWRRLGIVAAASLIALTGVGLAVVALRSAPGPGRTISRTVSSSVGLGSGLTCTVSAPAIVQPGGPIGVRFTYENGGDSPARVSTYPGDTTFTVKAADGTEYDTAKPLELLFGPYPEPITLQPGGTEAGDPSSLLVRWGGPLTILPRCAGHTVPPVTLTVADPGPTPPFQEALDRAAASAQVFGSCMPGADGTSVVGTISPPDGASFEPFGARCWAEVKTYPGFATVTFAFVSPSSARAVPLTQYWFDLRFPKPSPSEASQWSFVVTGARVYSVDGPAGSAQAPPSQTDVDYQYANGRWTHQNPGTTCGGGSTQGPGLYFFIHALKPC